VGFYAKLNNFSSPVKPPAHSLAATPEGITLLEDSQGKQHTIDKDQLLVLSKTDTVHKTLGT
jgi:hypothetical protein